MYYDSIIDELLFKGKEKMDDVEVFIVTNKSLEIGVFKGELNKYSVSESGGLSLRGLVDGKIGYSYTEKIDSSYIDMLIEEAYNNGKYIDALDNDEILGGSLDYDEINNYSDKLSTSPIDEKIELTKNMEKEAHRLDKRVMAIQHCAYEEFEKERIIVNTKGVKLKDKQSYALAYISVVVKEGEDTKTGMAYRIFTDLSEIHYEEIAKEAVDEAISMLNASSKKSDIYPTVIKNTVFADLLDAFSSVFSADNAQKGLSPLNDKIGDIIANPILTLVDNPLYDGAYASRAFDDEGTRTSYKKIIDKGILTTLLHNGKTAKKEKLISTGNGARASYKSPLGIAPSNFYIENGNKTFEELVRGIDNGVYIINLAGLHSGLNPVSGDFSLSAYGYEILNGKIDKPINQITIAGNLYEVLLDIEAIGNDLTFSLPGNSQFGSPSIRIKQLSIAGD